MMGQNITLKCDHCKNTISLSTGQGIQDNKLSRVLGYFDDKDQEFIQKELKAADKDSIWSFERMIASCRVNHNIVSIPTFHIIDVTDRIIAARCTCGGEHDIFDPAALEEGLFKIKCPKCGHDMTYRRTGYWD